MTKAAPSTVPPNCMPPLFAVALRVIVPADFIFVATKMPPLLEIVVFLEVAVLLVKLIPVGEVLVTTILPVVLTESCWFDMPIGPISPEVEVSETTPSEVDIVPPL